MLLASLAVVGLAAVGVPTLAESNLSPRLQPGHDGAPPFSELRSRRHHESSRRHHEPPNQELRSRHGRPAPNPEVHLYLAGHRDPVRAEPVSPAIFQEPDYGAIDQVPGDGATDSATAISTRVEIVRTAYGVPHILAEDLRAMGFALAWLQCEDYSSSIAFGFMRSRGELSRHLGAGELDSDFAALDTRALALRSWALLGDDARVVYDGFARGLNHYIETHPEEFAEWIEPDFTGIDALARDVQSWSRSDAARFVSLMTAESAGGIDGFGEGEGSGSGPSSIERPGAWPHSSLNSEIRSLSALLDGSNAWALDGSRTTTGRTILFRNPHLPWGTPEELLEQPSGLTYYEAHVRVPGVVDFYGDFRIGGAFGIIGGFNPSLGWATTNNYPKLSQVYAFAAHPTLANHIVLDGEPVALEERVQRVAFLVEGSGRDRTGNTIPGTVPTDPSGAVPTVQSGAVPTVRSGTGPTGRPGTEPTGQNEPEPPGDRRNADRLDVATRSTWFSPHGPVIHRDSAHVYVLKDPRDGEFRRGEQFLGMMMATDLEEWLGVMRMRAHPTSNFIYADAAGNIAHYYNARLPDLPHPSSGNSAVFVQRSDEIWSSFVPWEDLPLYINPPGGYVQQANDTPEFTNLRARPDRDTLPPNLPEPRLRLRSQLSLDLIGGDEVLSLEDVVALKHSPRMLLAERVLDDLLEAARSRGQGAELTDAVRVLEGWDRTAHADSRGGVLFKRWAADYFALEDEPEDDVARPRWEVEWSEVEPTSTPRGLGNDERAVRSLTRAAASLEEDGIAFDAEWGEVHRMVRGEVDAPVSGCEPTLGCFRTLSFERLAPGRYAVNRGDSWVFAVEFGDRPRAYTVLGYTDRRRARSRLISTTRRHSSPMAG